MGIGNRTIIALAILLVATLAFVMARAPVAHAVYPRNVYRFYNLRNGTHFYTAGEAEKASVQANYASIYRYEGIAWTLNADSPYATQPLYRFYNKRNGSHFYTASLDEANYVIQYLSATYTYEGPAYNVSRTPVPGGLTVYRFYYAPLGSHFYTASLDEANRMISTYPGIYILEGPAFYIPTPPPGAYNFDAASAYADKWSDASVARRNPAYPDYSAKGGDCTNFISQCLHDREAGNRPLDSSGTQQWWVKRYGLSWEATTSWIRAVASYDYMMSNPAGSYVYGWDYNPVTAGYPTPPDFSPLLRHGDIIYYDWFSSGSYNHAGIVVGVGYDPNQRDTWGNFADSHSNERRHAVWHLRPYNGDWRTTRIAAVRPL